MPITHTLHRQLLRRLLTGGVVIAVFLGGAVLWLDVERVEEAIIAMGVEEARQLSPHLPADLDSLGEAGREAVDRQLDSFIAERALSRGGHFVIAELYDMAQKPVADGIAADGAPVEQAIDLSVHHFPSKEGNWYAAHLIGGQAYLQVVTPLKLDGGNQTGWFEGVYLIPHQTIVELARSGLRASALVVVAVMATTALLYPLLASLNAGLIARSRAVLQANLGTLEALGGAIAKRDSDTNAHNYRVTLYAVRLAEAVGLAPERIRTLIKGAFLHDVGKIAIPDAVLLKPGKLDAVEFAIMKTHVAHGLDLVEHFSWLKDAAEVVGGHHEKMDGGGYPAGLAGESIPLTARIFAIADVFDALTSRRPYKEPFPLERALDIMTEASGSHFDTALLDCFRTIVPALHLHLGGREDDTLREELRTLTEAYFAGTLTG